MNEHWLAFGKQVRSVREDRQRASAEEKRRFSLRAVAGRVGFQPAYLSKIERGLEGPPGEEKIVRIAEELGEDPDVLLALGGKVSSDLLEAIRRRPRLFCDLIRAARELPDKAVLRLVREVRDGDW